MMARNLSLLAFNPFSAFSFCTSLFSFTRLSVTLVKITVQPFGLFRSFFNRHHADMVIGRTFIFRNFNFCFIPILKFGQRGQSLQDNIQAVRLSFAGLTGETVLRLTGYNSPGFRGYR